MADPVNGSRPGLIVTRTPLRISFAGGGTDLAVFYEREGGAVLNTTINKFVYVTVRHHSELFNEAYRLSYSETEHAERLDDIRNDIARECLRLLEIDPPIYISTVADLPAFSGLGSSSSFAVGLLNALHAYREERVTAGQLAQEACQIEIDVLKRPIGKQDQYAAAFGGLNLFTFCPDGSVTLEPQRRHQNGTIEDLFRHLMMFWTGIQRSASSILTEQRENVASRLPALRSLRDHAHRLRGILRDRIDPIELGRTLDETWRVKRRLASGISSDRIDVWYERAIEAGATGGKLCGAGGGGFLMLVVEPGRQAAVRRVLHDMTEVEVAYETQGSRLLLPMTE